MKTVHISDHVKISGPLNGYCVQGYQHQCVEELCKNFVSKDWVVVEVGCRYGTSTEIFSRYAKSVIAVDPFDDFISNRRYKDTTKGIKNIIKIKGFSPEVSSEVEDDSVDMVYLDAEHSKEAVLADLKAWLPKIRSGGIISGHDYHLHKMPEFGVPLALHETFGRGPDVCFADTSWLYKTFDINQNID